MDNHYPKITQDGKDGDEEIGYIANIMDSVVVGFKYFKCHGIQKVKIKVRGYCKGYFEVRTKWDEKVLGKILVDFTNIWKEYSVEIKIPDGKQAIYFTYSGEGRASLASFSLE